MQHFLQRRHLAMLQIFNSKFYAVDIMRRFFMNNIIKEFRKILLLNDTNNLSICWIFLFPPILQFLCERARIEKHNLQSKSSLIVPRE